MSQALYRKWRPQTWDAVVGQQHVVQTLHNALAADRIAHAYLFAGPRGTGKTTTARLLAKAVNCLNADLSARPCGECEHCQAVEQGRFLDLIEIDAASNTSVEDVRDLRDKINFLPNQGKYKVYIVDEVHMLSTAAFNALLKTLEEPPTHAIFVLATTEAHRIPATVLSRCQRHEFRRIPVVEIIQHLEQVAQSESIQVEAEALALIARQSTGAMRDAISLLDQLASTGQTITLAWVQEALGTAASQAVLTLVDALIEKDPACLLDTVHTALDSGSDPRQFARQIVDYLRDLLIMRTGSPAQIETTPEARLQMERHAQAFTPAEIMRLIRLFNTAAVEGRSAWQPALPLEMACIEALELPEAPAAPRVSSQPVQPAPAQPPVAPVQAETVSRAPAPPPTSAEVSEEDVQSTRNLAGMWDKVLGLVRQQDPKTYGLMNSCKSRFMRRDQVLLGFASDIVKAKMEKPENFELAQNALSQILERPVTIRCYVDTHKRSAIPDGVDNDGMVAAALRELGGELVDIN
ncbi:MAG: hypothetical protein B6D39_12505 [Anaerolineae bacterium UTCFX2]|jgi:DNA polymerase-3 subunit gamma/tau|nr:DNA polymerase III subunit gamma/tau [Anaerolineae bacterium]MCZ7552591.1 DNA polymerase III subunit gamma/tau [Anaerolineales bacterium]OQY87729.1 MAG: hypothetical protein B6D39_12505 [Anaerolineae bacterium UTCFX2]